MCKCFIFYCLVFRYNAIFVSYVYCLFFNFFVSLTRVLTPLSTKRSCYISPTFAYIRSSFLFFSLGRTNTFDSDDYDGDRSVGGAAQY